MGFFYTVTTIVLSRSNLNNFKYSLPLCICSVYSSFFFLDSIQLGLRGSILNLFRFGSLVPILESLNWHYLAILPPLLSLSTLYVMSLAFVHVWLLDCIWLFGAVGWISNCLTPFFSKKLEPIWTITHLKFCCYKWHASPVSYFSG